MSQNDLKTTSLMTSVTKNPHPQPKIFFFECNLLDWPICLSPWTAIWHNRQRSWGIGKATENCCFLGWNWNTNISYTGSQSVKLALTDHISALVSWCNQQLWWTNYLYLSNAAIVILKTCILLWIFWVLKHEVHYILFLKFCCYKMFSQFLGRFKLSLK